MADKKRPADDPLQEPPEPKRAKPLQTYEGIEATLPIDWYERLAHVFAGKAWRKLCKRLDACEATIFPPKSQTFAAFELTPFEDTRVVILGQDPYHDDGQAHGLSFSVQDGVKIPPSLRNIFKELGKDQPTNGNLEAWAHQGVLLLNTVLTVEAHKAGSHRKWGWEELTDAVIEALNEREEPVVFMLWGNPAKAKKKLITAPQHMVLESVHPSPLSAYRGFFGCGHFKACNAALKELGLAPITW